MIITPIPFDVDLAKSPLERSEGLHMSTIYDDMFRQTDPERYAKPMKEETRQTYFGLGLALETLLEEALLKRQAFRPDEFRTKEGIAFSPDLLIFNGITRVGEMKLTWKSSAHVPRQAGINVFPPSMEKYVVQVMSYAHALDTNYGRLYAVFVNGDYFKGKFSPMRPEALAWDLEFTNRELRDNHQRIINHARHMKVL